MTADEDFTHKLVLVVRKDLKLSAGKLAAQVAHAAVDCALRAKADKPRFFDRWYKEGQKKVVVKAEDERALHELRQRAQAAGLPSSLISDAGHTEIPAGTVTCLGVGPGPNAMVDGITGGLALM